MKEQIKNALIHLMIVIKFYLLLFYSFDLLQMRNTSNSKPKCRNKTNGFDQMFVYCIQSVCFNNNKGKLTHLVATTSIKQIRIVYILQKSRKKSYSKSLVIIIVVLHWCVPMHSLFFSFIHFYAFLRSICLPQGVHCFMNLISHSIHCKCILSFFFL